MNLSDKIYYVDLDKYDVGFLLSLFETTKDMIKYNLLTDEQKKSYHKIEKAIEKTK